MAMPEASQYAACGVPTKHWRPRTPKEIDRCMCFYVCYGCEQKSRGAEMAVPMHRSLCISLSLSLSLALSLSLYLSVSLCLSLSLALFLLLSLSLSCSLSLSLSLYIYIYLSLSLSCSLSLYFFCVLTLVAHTCVDPTETRTLRNTGVCILQNGLVWMEKAVVNITVSVVCRGHFLSWKGRPHEQNSNSQKILR